MIKKFNKRLKKEEKTKNTKLKKKFIFLYILSVLIPVIIVDVTLVSLINRYEKSQQESQLEASENEVIHSFVMLYQQCVQTTSSIAEDEALLEFLEQDYRSEQQFKAVYEDIKGKCSLNYYQYCKEIESMQIYVDNDTIAEVKGIKKLTSSVKKSWWYTKYRAQDAKVYLFEDITRDGDNSINPNCGTISIVREIEDDTSGKEMILVVDLDYSLLYQSLITEYSGDNVYICRDNRIIFSNDSAMFEGNSMPVMEDIRTDGTLVKKTIPITGKNWTVVMRQSDLPLWNTIISSKQIIIFLLLVNLLLPTIVISGLVKSVLKRLYKLEEHFDSLENEQFLLIEERQNGDEIDELFRHYNQMVLKMKKLIQTVIRKNNEKHLLEVSQKQAQLNALNTQVNPHFMYNTLECVCMRSMIKGEKETSSVIRDLSVLLRQMSKWDRDVLYLEEELGLVQRYLAIQKYRFDERISSLIDFDEECRRIMIPKLSLVSFVENACVHGIEESMDGGSIYVTAQMEGDDAVIRIKDTGCGMSEEKRLALVKKLENANIELLFYEKSTGVLNAYIRLKMHFGKKFSFQIMSKENEGTTVEFRLYHYGVETREEI